MTCTNFVFFIYNNKNKASEKKKRIAKNLRTEKVRKKSI